MNDRINAFADFISKQLIKEGAITEANSSDILAKAEKHADGADLNHEFSYGSHHVFSHVDADTEDDHQPYHVHDTNTGKTHTVMLSSKKHSVDSVHKALNKAVPGGVHKDLASKLASLHNENF